MDMEGMASALLEDEGVGVGILERQCETGTVRRSRKSGGTWKQFKEFLQQQQDGPCFTSPPTVPVTIPFKHDHVLNNGRKIRRRIRKDVQGVDHKDTETDDEVGHHSRVARTSSRNEPNCYNDSPPLIATDDPQEFEESVALARLSLTDDNNSHGPSSRHHRHHSDSSCKRASRRNRRNVPSYVVESDSFNEFWSSAAVAAAAATAVAGGSAPRSKASRTKRRKRNRHIVMDVSNSSTTTVHSVQSSSSSTIIAHEGMEDDAMEDWKRAGGAYQQQLERKKSLFGGNKRKRIHGSGSNSKSTMLNPTMLNSFQDATDHDAMAVDMDTDSPQTSGCSSSSESSDDNFYGASLQKELNEQKARDGDDEFSDWVGEDTLDGDFDRRSMDSLRPLDFFSMLRRVGDDKDPREFRAGLRRVVGLHHSNSHSTTPSVPGSHISSVAASTSRISLGPLTIKTSINEHLSKFLQDPRSNQIKLPPLDLGERVKLGHLATLYSLNLSEDVSMSGDVCPVVTKTGHTAHMDSRLHDDDHDSSSTATAPPPPPPPFSLNIVNYFSSSSSKKRVKK